MRTRRGFRWVAGLVVLGTLAVACGNGGSADRPHKAGAVGALTDVTQVKAAGSADPELAGEALRAFGDDLFTAAANDAAKGENVVVSPASVAIALALLEPGAVGAAATQLHALLHIKDPVAFHASMSALEQDLEARTPSPPSMPGEKPGEATIRFADAAYLQVGYPFRQAYLDAIGRAYGPVLQGVDFSKGPDAVAHQIDRFVSEATFGRIPELIGDGVLQRDDVLALVNAVYLKVSWQQPFASSATEAAHPFTRADGSTVKVPLMVGTADSSARGDGWVGAGKSYIGGLAAEFVLPDAGRFDDVAAHLGSAFAAFADHGTGETQLSLPRFTTRHHQELSPALKALGLTAPYEEGHLTGIADDRQLVLSAVIHETFVAMDEAGTEAAAATAAFASASSARVAPPEPVVLDRPFLFRIYDQHTGATLFIGRILDPSA